MAQRMIQRLGSLLDHYVVLCVALAVGILSFIGVGDVRITSVLGFVLCIAGMVQGTVRADLWVLIPLLVYDAAAIASSVAAYGNPVDGYGAMHALFPVVYLLMGSVTKDDLHLLKRCCVLWAAAVATAGIVWFVVQAVAQGRAGRLSGVLGNPNAIGIFLVVGWLVMMHVAHEDRHRPWNALFSCLEPVLLMALAMTLSMGSFLAMAVGIGVLLAGKKRGVTWKERFQYACQVLARVTLGMGTGILLYLAAVRTSVPWISLLVLAYAVVMALFWNAFQRFLEQHLPVALAICVLGIVVAGAAVVLRPSATATFSERIEMMGSGAQYLIANPLFGVGPLRWRMIDLADGGKYFNTWHIHNVPIHIGVEMGWITMAAILFVGVSALCKRKPPHVRAGTAAFLFHNLLDTSFFYLGITTLAIAATGQPETGAKKINGIVAKILFGVFAALFAYSLCHAIWLT